MSNTLNGINISKIAMKSLDFFGRSFYPLLAFHRDFSEEVKDQGDNVTTRVPTAVTAVDVSGGYTAQNVATTAVTITMNKNKGFPWAFTDAELIKAAGNFDWLKSIFLQPAAEAVLKAMVDDSLALVTAANFATSRTVTAANWDADDAADCATDLSTNKAPKAERAMLLKPNYYGATIKDSVVEDLASSGSTEALREAEIRRLRGFNVFEYTDIPANGESLEGIAQHPSALCLAARTMITPTDFPGQILNVTEPVTGLPLQWRSWYSPNDKKHFISVEAFYGVAVGNGAGLVRIVSA